MERDQRHHDSLSEFFPLNRIHLIYPKEYNFPLLTGSGICILFGMYGMVNQAVKGFVEENHGQEMWKNIHTKAGAPESFAAMSPYEDSITYNLVGAASELLNVPAEIILRGLS